MTPPRTCDAAVDIARFEAVEELAALNISLWTSIAEAAFRREPAVMALHCRQVRLATREAFNIAKSIGLPAARSGSA